MTLEASTQFLNRFRIPLIAAPMTGVSGLNLAVAAAACGIGAGFPVHNAAPGEQLDTWLDAVKGHSGPALPNLVVHRTNDRIASDLATVIRHRVPAVITSVGSPEAVVGPLHDAGILVLADVASLRHAERAAAAGVDGLVLLCAGAGGQTGWANPFVFARAVRSYWDGLMVLAGGVVDGVSMLAALVVGYDLVYMGTPFIATSESAAAEEYKAAVVAASMDDIEISAITGLASSMIRAIDEPTPFFAPAAPYDARVITQASQGATQSRFSAGHSVSGVEALVDVATLVDRMERELLEARRQFTNSSWSRRPFVETGLR